MRTAFAILLSLILILKVGICFADVKGQRSTLLEQLRTAGDSRLLIDAIPEAKEFKDKALSTYVARKLARNYPFSPTASDFLNAVRSQTPEKLNELKGRDFWFVPLTFLRVLVILSALLMSLRFSLRSIRTATFTFFLIVLIVGEGINLNKGLFTAVFIPLEGEHFSLSAPESTAQAVEKLPTGAEIRIGEIVGDWIKLDLPSGRVGWALTKDGIVENEDQ